MSSYGVSGPIHYQTVLSELRSGASLLHPNELEELAEELHRRASGAGLRALARTQRIELVVTESLPEEAADLELGSTLLVARCRAWPRTALACLHGIAHRALRRRHHSHADVWCLTLALALPKSCLGGAEALELVGPDDAIEVPAWAHRLRLWMAIPAA